MEDSPSQEGSGSSAGQDIPHIFWYPRVHQYFRNNPPLFPTLGQMNPVHSLPSYLSMKLETVLG